MSINLAVWEGPQPVSEDEAVRTFEALYERYVEGEDETPPTNRIAAYAGALTERYPDLTDLDDDAVDDSPWADGPLINNATGPFMYFSLVTNRAAEDAWSFAVSSAQSAGLVCYDPQSGALAK